MMENFRMIGFIYLVGIMIFSIGCKKDWFDIKSDITKTVPVTLQDFEYLLDEFTTMNQSTASLGEVGSDGHYMPESRWLAGVGIQPAERNAYTWTNALIYADIPDWEASYKRIFQCNLVLDGLKKINNVEDPTRYNRVKGNALFHRAKNYYDLAQIYAQPYQANTASSDMGIPLKQGTDVTELAKQSSVKLTYEQILNDLFTASNLLPILPEIKSRASKTASFALLARTYLTMSDYENAGIYADSSLRLFNKLIDFNTISPTATDIGRFNLETIFYAQSSTLWSSIWRSGYVFVDPSLYALYENNDLRKTRFFSLNGNDIVFKGAYNNSTAVFNGLAVDEQYLIKAECFARAGNIAAAMKDLNDLLKTRWNNAVSYTNIVAVDAEDALRKVLLERRKELLFRNLRWTDLRRLNLDVRFKETLTRTIGGATYTLEPGSYKYTLPIPQDVLNLGPKMKQTPGW